MTRILSLALVALLAAGGSYWYMTQNQGNLPGVSLAEAQNAGSSTAAEGDVALAPDYALGTEDAPVVIYEYASFTCPHCAHFHEDVFGKLKANYIDTGKVRFIQREVYFDRFGLWAGMIARCGGEMRYYGISGMLYDGQKDWIGNGEPGAILDNLKKIGRLSGLSDEEMSACLQDDNLARSMVAAYQTHADADQIEGTPTLIINGTKHSNMSYEDLAKIIDGLLAQ